MQLANCLIQRGTALPNACHLRASAEHALVRSRRIVVELQVMLTTLCLAESILWRSAAVKDRFSVIVDSLPSPSSRSEADADSR